MEQDFGKQRLHGSIGHGKTGSRPKEELGLRDDEKVRPGQFEAMCNPW
jgi:uncharacterized metal-binding protein